MSNNAIIINDELLEKYGDYFVYNNILEKYGIQFELFLKLCITGAWEIFINEQ